MNATRVKRLITLGESVEERLDELKRELKPLCLALAEAHGIAGAQDFSDAELSVSDGELCVKWYEYWRGEVYDTPSLRVPLRFLDLTPDEFTSRLAEIKAHSRAHSPHEQRCAEAKASMEADERRTYEHLKTKFG